MHKITSVFSYCMLLHFMDIIHTIFGLCPFNGHLDFFHLRGDASYAHVSFEAVYLETKMLAYGVTKIFISTGYH